MKTPRTIASQFLTLGKGPGASRRTIFINGFSIVGIVSLTIFGVANYFLDMPFGGAVEVFLALLAVGNVIAFRRHGREDLASYAGLCIMLLVLGFLLYSGGIAGTGFLWLFTFPALAFFLEGRRNGLWWLLGMFGEIAVFAALDISGLPFTSFYHGEVLVQLAAAVLAVSALIYFYQYVAERDETDLRKRTADLETEVQRRASLESSLASAVAAAKSQNDELERTKLATLNLLEDLNAEKSTLQRERAKDEAMLGSIGDAVFAIDAERRIMLFNPVAAALSGYSVAEAMGKKYDGILRFISEDSGKPVDAFVATALAGNKAAMSNHTAIIRKDGVHVPVADSAAPILDAAGKVTGVVVVFRDVTREREVDRAKTEFVSLASHQLRTPLSAIGWYAELLRDKKIGKLGKKQGELVDQIMESNRRMVELVNSLLNVSRIDMGTMASDPRDIDMPALIQSVSAEMTPQVDARRITLKTDYAASAPRIFMADPQLMRIIIQNLLSNAVKYTPEKGSVTVAVSADKKTFRLSVADTGYGIPESAKAKIFTKLYRADNAREIDADGNGLGLYLVKSVIEENGGKVWFESREGKGTTFFIELPISGMRKIEGSKTLSA